MELKWKIKRPSTSTNYYVDKILELKEEIRMLNFKLTVTMNHLDMAKKKLMEMHEERDKENCVVIGR